MKQALTIVQIILSSLLIASILLQSQGQGLGAFGSGGGELFKSKRGVEKIVFRATIVLSVLFFVSLIAQFLLP